MSERHNPQKLTPEQFGGPDGWRLLNQEEAAVLFDVESRSTLLYRALAERLALEFWSDSACVWRRLNSSHPAESLTYRTQAAEIPIAPEPVPVEGDKTGEWFIWAFNTLATRHHAIMLAKGFWNGEEAVARFLVDNGRTDLAKIVEAAFDGQKIALQGSELSEALEGIRHGNGPDDKLPQFSAAEAEFADVILRLMDHAFKRGWKVAEALVAKLEYNGTRAAMHGGKEF